GVVELTQLALSFRLNEAPLMDWLLPGLKDVGQTMRHSLFIIIAGVLGLLAAESQTLTAVTMITIFTAIIFNLTLPIMAAAFGKLSVVIPAQKPYRFRRQRRADRSLKSTDDTTHDEK
ncbi:multidrug RND transporter, partial [Levilactobacillus brevis]|nr:multidrug RND transporter [Levilactobacillus brevis]